MKYCENYRNGTQTHVQTIVVGKNHAKRTAWCRVATKHQLILKKKKKERKGEREEKKNTVSTKHSKAKHNKMR